MHSQGLVVQSQTGNYHVYFRYLRPGAAMNDKAAVYQFVD